MLAIEEDTRLFELTDYEDRVVCEIQSNGEPCQNEATWIGICVVCGEALMFCDFHREWALETMKSGIVLCCPNMACTAWSGWLPFALGRRWDVKIRWEPYKQHRPGT